MKKIVSFVLSFTLLVSLTACGSSNAQGSQNEQDGAQTSSEPVCTHEWIEADFWTPKTCSKCGAIEGTKLAGDFEKHGYTCDVALGEKFKIPTMCYDDHSQSTMMECAVLASERYIQSDGQFKSDSLNLESKNGYAWLHVRAQHKAYDEKGWQFGFMIGTAQEDYYDVKNHDDTFEYLGEMYFPGFDQTAEVMKYSLNYKGQTYDSCYRVQFLDMTGWLADQTYISTYDFYYLIPDGYDGTVYGYYDKRVSSDGWKEGTYIFDNVPLEAARFFRAKDW